MTAHLNNQNLVAVATATSQTGFDSSYTSRHIVSISEDTTIKDLITWVDSKHYILSLVSLEIQNYDNGPPPLPPLL
jgi:hypothetical protein